MSDDLSAFAVEVHGLKSVLKYIGVNILGNNAASLEKAASKNKKTYCDEFYPPFRAGLSELEINLNEALQLKPQGKKESSEKSSLLNIIPEAKTAAENYDRDHALELIIPYADFTYDDETDELLKKIILALETFDCENAVKIIIMLEEKLNESI